MAVTTVFSFVHDLAPRESGLLSNWQLTSNYCKHSFYTMTFCFCLVGLVVCLCSIDLEIISQMAGAQSRVILSAIPTPFLPTNEVRSFFDSHIGRRRLFLVQLGLIEWFA